ncbi:MAG TPA: DUF503 domain-containing protein [Acidimicrobiales bacterium]|nr:DUF503 domain-containing protein [Acidimicrobiales bacterium]
MVVAALLVELHIRDSGSLKSKRAVVRHLLDTAKRRYAVAAAEVDSQDLWQRAGLGFAAVGADAAHVEAILDRVERFVWSHPEVDVLSCTRHWLELDG